MFCFKLFIAIVFMAAISNVNGHPETKVNCDVQRRCSNSEEEIVYATDNDWCHLFRNRCIFDNDVCQRREEKKTELKVVTKTECQEKCQIFCTQEYKPVCTEYNNTMVTFGNRCAFLSESCTKDQSYMWVQDGKCPEAAAA